MMLRMHAATLQHDSSIRRLPLNRANRVAVFEGIPYSVQQSSIRRKTWHAPNTRANKASV